ADKIHALDLANGAEKLGGPIAISPSLGSRGFDSTKSNQRAALTLANGRVYVAYASYCDNPAYYGWVLGYSAANLATAPLAFAVAADGTQGSIWQSGSGPAVDASGNLYVMTANGDFTAATGG